MAYSRREPVIALDSFRYRKRSYKEGSYLDRRRCGMPQRRLRRMIQNGKAIFAKDLPESKLEEYGFWYDPISPRIKLRKIEEKKEVLARRKKEQVPSDGKR